jgi:YesN/AraC family two-component response regulator
VTTRTLIADDEEDMRMLLRMLLDDGATPIEIVAEAADGTDALAQWRERRPDVVVLDERMPGLTGLQVAAAILAEEPEQPIILFSAYLTEEMQDEAARLGVRECVSKADVFTIPDAIRRVDSVK